MQKNILLQFSNYYSVTGFQENLRRKAGAVLDRGKERETQGKNERDMERKDEGRK